jgi:hypothetical protein
MAITVDQRETLGSPHGVTDSVTLAHGFTVGLLAGLVHDGLATATPKTVHAGRQPIEVTWLTIPTPGGGRSRGRSGAGWLRSLKSRALWRYSTRTPNECVWTDAIGALHANSYTCRDDARRMRSSVAARYIVAAPSTVPTGPAQAGQGQAIGHLLVVSQARRRRYQT